MTQRGCQKISLELLGGGEREPERNAESESSYMVCARITETPILREKVVSSEPTPQTQSPALKHQRRIRVNAHASQIASLSPVAPKPYISALS